MPFSTARSAMRAQAETVINDAASLCTVQRLQKTTDDSGHQTTTWSTVASSEPIWIQPMEGQNEIKPEGIEAVTTHAAFQQWDGYALAPKDRILPAGDSYYYDVVAALVFETHRMATLKRVLKS